MYIYIYIYIYVCIFYIMVTLSVLNRGSADLKFAAPPRIYIYIYVYTSIYLSIAYTYTYIYICMYVCIYYNVHLVGLEPWIGRLEVCRAAPWSVLVPEQGGSGVRTSRLTRSENTPAPKCVSKKFPEIPSVDSTAVTG